MAPIILIIAAYLIGSLSFAVIVSKTMRLPDPHSYGSGNPGATNVLRSGNKLAALLTLLGDALKGLVVVVAARMLSDRFGFTEAHTAGAGLAAFIGHLYPVFFGFKGGKGVATAAGVLFGWSLWVGLWVTGIWAVVFAASRISSVSALLAAMAAPVIVAMVLGSGASFLASLVMAGLLIWRHRENIRKLRAGTEGGFGKKQ